MYHSFGTGFYLLKDDRLTVGPYQGPVACQEMEKGNGVCWAAVTRKETLVVPDVNRFPGHIFCNSRSKSEITLPEVQRPDLFLDLFNGIGLGDQLIKTHIRKILKKELRVMCRQGDDGNYIQRRAQFFPDVLRGFDPVHYRHFDIHEYKVDLLALQNLDGLFTVLRQNRLVSCHFDQFGKQIPVGENIIHYQDFHIFHGSLIIPAACRGCLQLSGVNIIFSHAYHYFIYQECCSLYGTVMGINRIRFVDDLKRRNPG